MLMPPVVGYGYFLESPILYLHYFFCTTVHVHLQIFCFVICIRLSSNFNNNNNNNNFIYIALKSNNCPKR